MSVAVRSSKFSPILCPLTSLRCFSAAFKPEIIPGKYYITAILDGGPQLPVRPMPGGDNAKVDIFATMVRLLPMHVRITLLPAFAATKVLILLALSVHYQSCEGIRRQESVLDLMGNKR